MPNLDQANPDFNKNNLFMQIASTVSTLLLCLIGLTAQSQAIQKNNQVGKMQLVWSDEFDYKGLPDPQKWNYDVGGWGWGNNELQYYTKDSLGNARVENGLLTIELKQQSIEDRKYSSARLVTKGKGDWIYGRIDVRAKLPKGLGTWPAIWMLGSTTLLNGLMMEKLISWNMLDLIQDLFMRLHIQKASIILLAIKKQTPSK